MSSLLGAEYRQTCMALLCMDGVCSWGKPRKTRGTPQLGLSTPEGRQETVKGMERKTRVYRA